jgi:hypothetical protein
LREFGVAILSALGLSGCLSGDPAGEDLPYMTRGRTVIVYSRWFGDDPFPTAERYCAALNLTARPRTITGKSGSFDCVPDPTGVNRDSLAAGPTRR